MSYLTLTPPYPVPFNQFRNTVISSDFQCKEHSFALPFPKSHSFYGYGHFLDWSKKGHDWYNNKVYVIWWSFFIQVRKLQLWKIYISTWWENFVLRYRCRSVITSEHCLGRHSEILLPISEPFPSDLKSLKSQSPHKDCKALQAWCYFGNYWVYEHKCSFFSHNLEIPEDTALSTALWNLAIPYGTFFSNQDTSTRWWTGNIIS